MSDASDMTGMIELFGVLSLLERSADFKSASFRCDCGTTTTRLFDELEREVNVGHISSCSSCGSSLSNAERLDRQRAIIASVIDSAKNKPSTLGCKT